MSEENAEQGIYINGRQQIIDMLQFMNEADRKKLLQNISQRNAVMARELSEQSLSFNDLIQLNHDSLRKIFSQCNPAITGLALYNCTEELQRKVLSVIERSHAEAAYNIMSKNLSTKRTECKRAQEKVLQVVIQLSRKEQISI